ncbi:hypothetical protein B0H10DRAFT_1952699 [Mycena sp. CBHHK59/15]|nr:hypothetical protein B0H10DRAFT_1952699 [Mycena sp. CBHHK59/15]
MPKHYLNPFRKGVHRGGTPYCSAIHTPPSASRRREDEFRPFDPTPGQIQAFHEQYEAALAAGQIVTYSLEKKCLVKWFRPVTYNNQGAMGQLPASSFNCTPGIVLPVCPHLSNPFRLREECTMKCKKSQNHWVFCCPSHGLIVPPVASAKVLLTEQELTDYVNSEEYMDGDVTDSGDEGFSVKYNTSGSICTFISNSGLVAPDHIIGLFHRPGIIVLDSFITIFLLGFYFFYAYWICQLFSNPATSLSLQVRCALVAETRGSPNNTFVLNIYNNHEAGLYKTHPEQHPVHQSPLADMLLPYHPAVSICQIADCMQNMTTPTGLIIRQFTSTTGIPYITCLHLQKDNYPCLACNCMYPLMGHQQHRHRSGRCTNNVDLPMIEEQDPPLDEFPFLKFRSYPADAKIPSPQEFLNTLVGRAFVEWHSKIGVPQDVWAAIITAYVRFQHCDLECSFEADKAHRNEGGECQDIGQEQTSSILKGKGHEMVLYRMD